jgi:hypothetical protein
METRAFQPLYSPAAGTTAGSLVASTTVAASTSAAAGTLPGSAQSTIAQIEICNQTAAWAYVNFGVSGSVTAATVATGYPVGPGADKIVSVSQECNGVSVILAAGATAGSVSFTRGEGV